MTLAEQFKLEFPSVRVHCQTLLCRQQIELDKKMFRDLAGETIGVTGANGFVGRAVVAAILAGGGTPVALVRDERAAAFTEAGDIRTVGDIDGSTQWLPHLRGCSLVIHLAARVHVMAESEADPLSAFLRVNRDGSRKLAEDCAEAGVRRLVFASSVKVNGEETRYAAGGHAAPFTEADDPAPQDAYGQSKWEAEKSLSEIAAITGLEVSVVRPPLVYGPGVGGNMHRLLALVHKGIPLPLAAIDNRRSLIGVRNLADLLILAGQHPRAGGRIFLARDRIDLSTPDLIRALARALDTRARLFPVPVSLLRFAGKLLGRSAEIDRLSTSLQVSIDAAENELGWVPPVTEAMEFEAMARVYLKGRGTV